MDPIQQEQARHQSVFTAIPNLPPSSMTEVEGFDPLGVADDTASRLAGEQGIGTSHTSIMALQNIYRQNMATLEQIKAIQGSSAAAQGAGMASFLEKNEQLLCMLRQELASIDEMVEREKKTPVVSMRLQPRQPADVPSGNVQSRHLVEMPFDSQPSHEGDPHGTGNTVQSRHQTDNNVGTSTADATTDHDCGASCLPFKPYVNCALELRQFTGNSNDPELRSIDQITIFEKPHIVYYDSLLLSWECKQLIELCQGRFTPSLTSKGVPETDPNSYIECHSENRTSTSARLEMQETPLVATLERRIAAAAQLPLQYLESLVVVRYEPGQYFNKHHDGDFRTKTLLLYLTDVEDGGETLFSYLGLMVKPRAGSAICWWNCDKDSGEADLHTLHSGTPPRKGIKYAVNCFFNKEPVREENGSEIIRDDRSLRDGYNDDL